MQFSFHPLDVDFLGIIAATFTSFIVRFIWFEAIFREVWRKNSGLTKRDSERIQSNFPKLLGRTFFLNLINCFVIAMFIETFKPQSYVEVIIIVSVIWLGFIVTTSLNGVLWEGEKAAAYFVNIGDKLATYISVGLVYYLVSQLDSIDQSPNVVITSDTFSH